MVPSVLSSEQASGTLRRSLLAVMIFPRALLLVVVVALVGAWPAAAGVRLVARDEPLGRATHEARKAPVPFDMVGLHWRGAGTVWFRTRSLSGVWSEWQPARPEAEDAPDLGTRESRARSHWKLGNPYWTGASDAIEYRFRGHVTRLRAFFINSSTTPTRERTIARAVRPGIIRRAQWGADESIVRAPPYYAARVRFAAVHHTAGTNSYTAAESAAIVRGIQRYHVLANGWNDIGYNFLVDKYGQVFEGRGGGLDQNVVGAHAQGYNTGSTGVSLLGTYSSSPISNAARSALVRLLAWRLDVAHVDPLARLSWVSGGNPEYAAGTVVSLRTISGHRDTGPTSCPGNGLYAQLPGIRSSVAALGLPKLYDPEVTGKLGGPVRVTGRLSTSLPWTVTIRAADGSKVAGGSGTGTRVDWTWDASAYPFGSYTYTAAAGPDVRPWTARVPGPPALAIRRLRATPPVLTPNGDGNAESVSISFFLTTAATVTADVVDGSGTAVRRLANARSFAAGTGHLRWGGRNDRRSLVPDGDYTLKLTAESPGQTASRSRAIVVDRTLGFLTATQAFSPNGDGRLDEAAVTFMLARVASVRVLVLHDGVRVATLQRWADLTAGLKSYSWDGSSRGTRAADRRYRVRVEAETTLGTRVLRKQLRLDTTAPTVRIIRAVARRRTSATITVSEAGLLRVWFVTSPVVVLNVSAGTHVVSHAGVFRRVRARAQDAAGNRSTFASLRVRRL
jgi:flagellar hook assembly protein FlgD